MELPTYFRDFLSEIRPTPSQRADSITGHQTLRERLLADRNLAPLIVSTFLQGSYRRATAVRPKGDKRSDVDVIVVTKLSEAEYTPEAALALFVPFLKEHYNGKWRLQGRSFGIELTYVDLDLVITSAPSKSEIGILESASVTAFESPDDVDDWRLVKSWIPVANRDAAGARWLLEAAQKETEWQLSPLRIPDREAQRWEATHPLAQIRWTWDKNRRCNKHYVNVVKAIKWWRRVNHPTYDRPKGYPVEHLIGQCCPDGITSVAQGVVLALEAITRTYKTEAANGATPYLPDHGVPDHDVFARISGADFADFYEQVGEAAGIARAALDSQELCKSVEKWRQLFGARFPDTPDGVKADPGESGRDAGGYTARREVTTIGGGRWA